MSNKNRKKPKKTKVRNRLKELATRSDNGLNHRNYFTNSRQAIKLAERGENPSLKKNITQMLICVKICCGN